MDIVSEWASSDILAPFPALFVNLLIAVELGNLPLYVSRNLHDLQRGEDASRLFQAKLLDNFNEDRIVALNLVRGPAFARNFKRGLMTIEGALFDSLGKLKVFALQVKLANFVREVEPSVIYVDKNLSSVHLLVKWLGFCSKYMVKTINKTILKTDI